MLDTKDTKLVLFIVNGSMTEGHPPIQLIRWANFRPGATFRPATIIKCR